MPIGPVIRALFGRHERRIADLYRGLFMDLGDYGAKIGAWAPDASRILEVGCGEGAVTEILAKTFPRANILAIDITPRAGRLYRGRREGVRFRNAAVQDIAGEHPGAFDLIVLSDVIHHVPLSMRSDLLEAIGQALAPGGRFVLKDWGRSAAPIHWLGYAGDRWLTGDRVAYLTPAEAQRLVAQSIPALKLAADGRIRPWRNNYALLFAC